MILGTIAERQELLARSKTIAMVGASANPLRPSYTVFSYLRTQGRFAVTPINPTIAAIDGVKAYPSLAAYATENGAPDIVDVFRKPSEVVEMDQRMSSRDVSVDTPIGSDEESTMLDLLSSGGTPEDEVVDAHYQKVVAEKMREFGETLTGKDRTIFEKRLLTEEPMTLQEIGEMYDISRERVRQIEERLKKRLKQYLLTDMRDLETVEVVNPNSRRRKRKGGADVSAEPPPK